MNQILINGVTIAYNQREDFWKAVERGEWERKTFEVLNEFIVEGKLFVDIGAWNGVLSIYAAKLGAHVMSVEPDYKALEELRSNIVLNECVNKIAVDNIAIAGRSKIDSIHSSGFGNSMTSLIERKDTKLEDKVHCYSLSDYLHEDLMDKVCLIKIDTEGSEIEIIPAAKEFLTKHKPPILLSLHPFWFADYDKNVKDIVDTIAPIYNMFSVETGKQITPAELIKELSILEGYEILLVP